MLLPLSLPFQPDTPRSAPSLLPFPPVSADLRGDAVHGPTGGGQPRPLPVSVATLFKTDTSALVRAGLAFPQDIDESHMPQVPFESLPGDARLWVFAAADPVSAAHEPRLLAAVDGFLADWRAHGEPLTNGRVWRDQRFLAVAVDQSTAGASGCSIDGLFRSLTTVGQAIGTTLLGGGRVYYRDASGAIVCVDRATFGERAARGEVTAETPVFDTTVGTAQAWRERFELPARESWHAQLLAGARAG